MATSRPPLNPLPARSPAASPQAEPAPASAPVPAVRTAPGGAILRLVDSLRGVREASKPITFRNYMLRIQRLPRNAVESGDDAARAALNGFASPKDLTPAEMRQITAMNSSRYQKRSHQNDADKPIGLLREMLLLAYEAKPRVVSLAITGYTISDFIAYIYQDVILHAMNLMPLSKRDDNARLDLFIQHLADIKQWLMLPLPGGSINTPQRHIRRRLIVLLARNGHQVASLLEDRELPAELEMLVYKLLERDDDVGYTQGQLRNFRDVRADFNALAEFCVAKHYQTQLDRVQGQASLQDLDRVICPATVPGGDFSALNITRWAEPRVRAPRRATGPKTGIKIRGATQPAKPPRKTAQRAAESPTREQADSLDALAEL